jgi:hypothetical protein
MPAATDNHSISNQTFVIRLSLGSQTSLAVSLAQASLVNSGRVKSSSSIIAVYLLTTIVSNPTRHCVTVSKLGP